MVENDTNAPISSEEYKKVTEELYKQNLEVVRLYKEVEKLNEELQIANEGQADLLHIINHQIKGYMTKARLVFDDLLEDGKYNLSLDAKPMIQQGFDSMTEGVNFVQNFLNASNIERGTFTYEMKPIDFRKIVEAESEKERKVAEKKELKFNIEIKDGNYNMVGDESQLNQAVRNLIDNSILYTPKGSVKIEMANDKGKIILRVEDTGVGISEELKPKLFTKGGTDKNSQKINVNSTGFGLSFVKGVIEAHKGRVWVESPGVGKGSTFFLELPAR